MPLPPLPVGVPPGHSYWNDWYEKLRLLINTTSFNHNDLLGLQGGTSGEYYHLTSAQRTVVTNTTGTNSGDVTLAGTPDYITISGQVITRGQIDLTTDVTGDLPLSNLAQSSAASKLLGRGSAAGAGDFQEITLGTNLSMSGTTLNATGGGTLGDGDYGDITVSSSGTVLTIDAGVVTLAKQADVATSTVFYRKTAGTGSPEVQTLATLKTDLGLTGTNSGDQTSIVGITGTKAQFDTAVTDGNFLYVGDITQYTDELAQDAVGAMVDTTLVYTDATPLLSRAALTGAITASAGSNTTSLGSFTVAQLNTALSDGDITTGGGTATGTNTGDQSLFSTIAVSGQSNVVADTTSDTLTLVAGTDVTITTDAGTDTITFSSTFNSSNLMAFAAAYG